MTEIKNELCARIYRALVENEKKVDERFRPVYHFSAPSGFINDPNGFSRFGGKYHLFYQMRSEAGIGWGHAESDDLISFTHLPPAVMPETSYDSEGCWSGGAVEIDGKLGVLYTGQRAPWGERPMREMPSLALSEDGVNFEKYEGNPVILPEMPGGDSSDVDFRDPVIWKHNGRYYVLVGNCKKSAPIGQVQMFASDDAKNWEYLGVAYSRDDLGVMYECPSFVELDEETDLLILSPMEVPACGDDYLTWQSTVYVLGKMDYEHGRFIERSHGEIDHGKDFYAAEVTKGKDGAAVLIAWMANWCREYYTGTHGVGFENNFTLPREISHEGDRLVQRPIRDADRYFELEKTFDASFEGVVSPDGFDGNCLRMKIDADLSEAKSFALEFFCGEGYKTVLGYDCAEGRITIDSSKSRYPTGGRDGSPLFEGIRSTAMPLEDGRLKLDIFLDINACEIFADEGRLTISQMSFGDPTDTGMRFVSDGKTNLSAKLFRFKK